MLKLGLLKSQKYSAAVESDPAESTDEARSTCFVLTGMTSTVAQSSERLLVKGAIFFGCTKGICWDVTFRKGVFFGYKQLFFWSPPEVFGDTKGFSVIQRAFLEIQKEGFLGTLFKKKILYFFVSQRRS